MDYKVPFISNTKDNLHCMQSAWMMVVKYFKPQFEMDWDKFSRVTGFEEDKGTWAMAGLLWLKKQGFNVIHLASFDYEVFAQTGGAYLLKRAGKDIGQWMIEHSNMPLEQKRARRLAKSGIWKKQAVQISDIKKNLDDGFLVVCTINIRKLDELQGYFGHVVVVKGYDDKKLFLHDPGLPGRPDRKVTYKDFETAWADPNKDAKELNAIKL
ncbi:hypothetical protein A3E49_02025 [Candidatus Saccharibacteria bacterium RIFCSPHIGHO2_12_FULL_49_19]|nr:MAG: hypothetical protein A2708_00565 [Candidatus Saccharibacteria bacterium RIFCSPHIGHO2_01_FULL_49_21]OGL36510.1 MAG: hypothetical protein A3E49_02025 [Candidatus Saccharibacteria bacterium RIFCSPHIGHO2_12_FULL_49_19]OGL38639.1 MAG: hypothetical protein A3B63_01175 [Candidatus Saccharibacteria bacterium RIFCSPLOWO2_01_FULL_49_22]